MLRCLFILVLTLLASCTKQSQAQQVVVSIKPLALIAQAVAPDDVTINVLIPAGASPHTYQLKPAQIMLLGSADAIFWVSPAIETGIGKQLARQDKAVQLESSQINDHHDMHSWLDPDWAIAQARTMVAHQKWPQEKLAQFEKNIALQQPEWLAKVSSINDMPVVVAHDAFSHWQHWAPFNQVAVVQPSAEHPAPASHLFQVDQLLQALNQSCIIVEPTTSERTLRFLKGYSLPTVTVDISGTQAKSYVQLIGDIADQFARCAQ